MNWKQAFVIVLVLVAVVASVASIAYKRNVSEVVLSPDTSLRTIHLAGQDIQVTVVSTPEERAKGLGGREGLAQDEGMLFVFDSDAKYQFWMKDMRFPIDILWLSDKGEVVDIRESVSPSTYPAVFAPNSPARYVLELPANFAKVNGVSIGEIVRL